MSEYGMFLFQRSLLPPQMYVQHAVPRHLVRVSPAPLPPYSLGRCGTSYTNSSDDFKRYQAIRFKTKKVLYQCYISEVNAMLGNVLTYWKFWISRMGVNAQFPINFRLLVHPYSVFWIHKMTQSLLPNILVHACVLKRLNYTYYIKFYTRSSIIPKF